MEEVRQKSKHQSFDFCLLYKLYTTNITHLYIYIDTPTVATTELYQKEGRLWESGPELIFPVAEGCVIALDDAETRHLLVGGQTSSV